MQRDDDIPAWGKGVLEELLLRSALELPGSADPAAVPGCALPFRVTADRAARQLVVSCPRIGGDDLVLRIDLPAESAAGLG
jgi:hypothetical protein